MLLNVYKHPVSQYWERGKLIKDPDPDQSQNVVDTPLGHAQPTHKVSQLWSTYY